jgi:hypothetical protein
LRIAECNRPSTSPASAGLNRFARPAEVAAANPHSAFRTPQ